ncbi:cytochrome-c peroxidase [Leucothrix arctica]|nr:cytochrome c peroxidase [Leucothrix arctica]
MINKVSAIATLSLLITPMSFSQTLDEALHDIIQNNTLTGNPIKQQQLSDIDSTKAQLGMKLFYSRALSGNLDTACASCHHPMLGGGDNLSLPVGVKSEKPSVLGLGRQRKEGLPPDIARNAPTTFNIALWQKVMFHDGRIESIGPSQFTTPDFHYPQRDPKAGENLVQAQARFPVTSDREMLGESFAFRRSTQARRASIAARLAGKSPTLSALPKTVTHYWLTAFRTTFSAPEATASQLITEQSISELLAEYQRSQLFIDTPWRQYINGNTLAISEEAKVGALLFYQGREKGGYACANCHSGDFFSNEKFYNILIPPIGPGKAGKNGVAVQGQDFGRRLVTRLPQDNYKFRVPSLLNTEVTGPWGHNGAYTSLPGIVKHMIAPKQMLQQYNPNQLKQKNIPVDNLKTRVDLLMKSNPNSFVKDKDYRTEDVEALVTFLKTLTDPCVKSRACLSPWIPNNESLTPLQLQGTDLDGNKH